MKSITKFLSFLFISSVLALLGSCSDDKDEPMVYDQLPEKAQTFLDTYFPSAKISSIEYDAEKDDQDYDVKLDNGYNITFDKYGDWVDVEAPEGVVIPAGIAPAAISKYVSNNYPDAGINEIEKIKTGYDVYLTNSLNLLFDTDGTYVGWD